VSSLSEVNEQNSDPCIIYVKKLSEVSFWEERLRSWKSFLEFSEREKEIHSNIEKSMKDLSSIMRLPSLQYVIGIILLYGNEMNRGTAKGSALGFRIDSILKLSSTRSTSSKGNLLDFILRQIRDACPTALNFAVEMRELSSHLSRMSLEMIAKNLMELSQVIKTNSESCKKIQSHFTSESPFHRVIQFFSEGKNIS
jgi:hypothetical protein